MTQLGDELLIAYSDGELSTRQREEIGCVLDHDPVTGLRLKKLQNACNRLVILFEDILADHAGLRVEHIINLPRQSYEEPYGAGGELAEENKNSVKAGPANGNTAVAAPFRSALSSLPARPERASTDKVSGKDSGGNTRNTMPFQKSGPAREAGRGTEEEAEEKTGEARDRTVLGKMALNILTGTAILTGGLAVGYFYQDYAASGVSDETLPNLYAPVVNGGWTTAVIHHHSLLRRETIEASRVNQKDVRLIRNQLENALGMRVMIPDFSAHGLSFARAQILTHNKGKIAQFTYLPGQGSPVSLYLRKSRKSMSLNNGSLGPVNMVHWAQDSNGFVLSGSLPHWKLIIMSVDVKRQFLEVWAQE